MALQLRPNCEYCDKDLPPESTEARICSYECTFCADCVETKIYNVCPNCGGGFVPRPIRPATECRLHLCRRGSGADAEFGVGVELLRLHLTVGGNREPEISSNRFSSSLYEGISNFAFLHASEMAP